MAPMIDGGTEPVSMLSLSWSISVTDIYRDNGWHNVVHESFGKIQCGP